MVDTDGDSRFDWDEANRDHISRHGVSEEEAEDALADPRVRSYVGRRGSERRTVTVGQTEVGRLLAVIHTPRRGKIRVLTAREANEWERRFYRNRK